MASKSFFDPVVLLRVAPVLTSTMAMRFSHDQWLFLDNFLVPENRERANEMVPSYFRTFFMRGIWDIGILYTLTTATGVTNLTSRPNGAWKWYAAGTALAVFHMAFAPFISTSLLTSRDKKRSRVTHQDSPALSLSLVVYKVKALSNDEPKGQGNKMLREWLKIHTMRSWAADIPAWACFVIGCLKSLKPL